MSWFFADQRAQLAMIWYVAFIAISNLGLGYLLGTYMTRTRPIAAVGDEAFDHEGI